MSEQILQTRGSVTTILGAVNQLSRFLNMEDKFTDLLGTTINTKRQVLASVVPTSSDMPKILYFGAGINGYSNTGSGTGSVRYNPYCTNLDLYYPIPVYCIPTASEEANITNITKNYRMRTKTTIGGTEYALYWLKVVTPDPNSIEVKQLDNGTETPYEFQSTDLKPTPIKPEEGGSTSTNKRVIVRGTLSVELTSEEISPVVQLLTGVEGYEGINGRISEYGFYSGCDVYTTTKEHIERATSATNYKEAIYTQLAKHICTRGVDLIDPGTSINPKVCFEYSDILPIPTSTQA